MRSVKISAFLPILLYVCGIASADVFYAASNYVNGSAGIIAADGGSFTVCPDAAANFGMDAAGFTFRDHDGAERAMMREYQYGPNDTVYVWDPADSYERHTI
jgi:hypothetical protein